MDERNMNTSVFMFIKFNFSKLLNITPCTQQGTLTTLTIHLKPLCMTKPALYSNMPACYIACATLC